MKVFGTDYDGVIINIEPQKAEAFGVLLNKRWGIDGKEASTFWIEAGGTSRRYKFDYFYKKRFNKKLDNERHKKIEKEYSNLLKKEFYPRSKLSPHALEILKYARSHFDYTFISSGIPMEEINYLVNLNGLSGYFDLILGTNEKYQSKQDHFKEIIEKQKPDLLVFIADGLEDVRIAKEFRAISIGVSTNHSREELLRAGATYVCDFSTCVSKLEKLIKD